LIARKARMSFSEECDSKGKERQMSSQSSGDLPRNFYRIRLELAREPGHPEGDRHIGYTLVAPLDAALRLDAETARAHRQECRVVRFHSGEESDAGYLRRGPGGTWILHYDFEDGSDDDDPGYRLGEHRFEAGEYVTIQEDEGAHTYRVVSVQPLAAAERTQL
jgi:hypothetical protein